MKTTFSKKKNDIFARHILATRKQQSDKTFEQFLQALKVPLQDCTFKAVNAEQYRKDLLQDTFINGLSSIQKWASFSREGPDLKKLLKLRAAR